jgi:hypothetical protein
MEAKHPHNKIKQGCNLHLVVQVDMVCSSKHQIHWLVAVDSPTEWLPKEAIYLVLHQLLQMELVFTQVAHNLVQIARPSNLDFSNLAQFLSLEVLAVAHLPSLEQAVRV